MKKLYFSLLMLVNPLACVKKPAASSPAESQTADSAKALPVLGVSIYKYEDTFMAGVREEMSKAAVGKAQINFVDGANQQPTQNEKIDLFLAKKVNGLMVNPVDRSSAGILIDKAKDSNTPIVFFNREPLAEDLKKWDKAYYVGTKSEESGRLAGEIIAHYWKNNPKADTNGDGVLQYVMLKGEPGHQDTDLRSRFAVLALEEAGIKIQELASDHAHWDRIKGQEKMAAFLAAYGDKIEAVIANNDDMALGAIEALKAQGYFKNGKFIPVVGVDATTPAIEALKEGTLLGTVFNDAKNQAIATLNIGTVLAQGGHPTKDTVGYEISESKYVWVPYKKVTKDNLSEFAQF